MKQYKKALITAFAAAGIAAPAAYVANDLTLPSEGVVKTVYKDPVGLPTVCVGHMDKALKMGTKYTIEECMEMFAADWIKHEKQLDKVVVSKKISYKSEWQKAALTDFTFNLGIGSVQSSTLVKLLSQGKHIQACNELSKWVNGRVNGKLTPLKGLITRRQKTMPYCLGDLPWDKQQAYEQFKTEYENEMVRQQKTDS